MAHAKIQTFTLNHIHTKVMVNSFLIRLGCSTEKILQLKQKTEEIKLLWCFSNSTLVFQIKVLGLNTCSLSFHFLKHLNTLSWKQTWMSQDKIDKQVLCCVVLHPYLPIAATSPQQPLSPVPKVAVMERFDCIWPCRCTTS